MLGPENTFTEEEKAAIKAKFAAMSPEDQKRVIEKYKEGLSTNIQAPIDNGVATLTYKQLAKNYPKDTQHRIRKTIKNMNKKKRQVQVVNGPGSIIKTEEGSFIITKKGKSMRI